MQELIVGMDISENISLISYYNDRIKDVESVPFWGNQMVLNNAKPLSVMLKEAQEVTGGKNCELKSHIELMLESVYKYTGAGKITHLCVTTDTYHITLLDTVKSIFESLGYGDEVSYISHVESYCHYVVTTRKELWGSGCALMDFTDAGLRFDMFRSTKTKEGIVVTVDSYNYTDGDVAHIIDGSKTLEDGSQYVEKLAREHFDRQIISSIYLTGEKFDEPYLPKNLLNYLCGKRRVFAGQNLYVKGACVAAAANTDKVDLSEFIFACDNRLTTTIEMDILEKGVPMRFRIAKAGNNWYASSRKFDCILNQVDSAELKLYNLGAATARKVNVPLNLIPYRPPKMTRVEMCFDFKGQDRCLVTVKDNGFGEFYKPSGVVVHQELEL